MRNSNFIQISSLGSKDKNNLMTNDAFKKSQSLETPDDGFTVKWKESPNNPLIQNFQSIFSNPKVSTYLESPVMQTKLFDADNAIKGQAGIFREPQDGLTSFGSDSDGKPLYAFNDIANDQSFDLGKNKLYTAGSLMQGLGAFQDEEEADRFAKFTANSGDPSFMGGIAGLSAAGDKKGAVNLIMNEFGYPDVDSLDTHDDKERAMATAFGAYNLVENVEKMSPAQQSLSLSTLGMMSYKFKDGTTLKDRALVKDPDGKTAFSLSDAFNLGGAGFDVNSMQKNWDQLNLIQNITYGKGTPSQLASTGKRMQLLGDPSMGGSAVRQTEADLGRLGFKSVPSAGMGAITGKGDALPQGYEVVGAGESPGQVIAVPKGLNFSTATLNGSPEIRSLNNAEGVKKASIGAFKTHGNWLPNKSSNELRGTSFGAGLGQSGILQDPYVTSSIATASVMGNMVTRSNKVPQDQVAGIRHTAEKTALNYATGGVSGKVTKGIDLVTGGKGSETMEKAQDLNDKVNPLSGPMDKLYTKGIDIVTSNFGGKSKEQQGRDAVREIGTKSGLFNKDNWTVNLSDGSTADIGKDGNSEKRAFRNPDKAIGEVRELNPYDVDYTNDLDFSSNMMTSSLVRLMSGGKGTPIDQVAGQLGNAALGQVGFSQDMTEENFNYVRDNVRGFYFKQGVQTKEDAYALSNQMFSEGRITETDAIAMQQGINMVFDDNGFDTAQVLMSGRWKGLEVAADIPASPGPNYNPAIRKPPTQIDTGETIVQDPVQETESYGLEMNAGTYGGNANTDAFTRSIIKYKDNWSTRNGRKG